MRIGIMGGTLDPVHNGHLQMAKTALEFLNLDRVMLLPAGDPPHKAHPSLKSDRLNMVRLAAAELEGVFPCSIEIFRNSTTYTVETLTELHEKNPNTDWFYIIGADTLDVLDTWRNFPQVAKLCTFAVFGRADEDASIARMREFEQVYGARFITMPLNGPDISSTDVRNRVAEGKSIADLVPTSVCNYIVDHGLYLCSHSKDEILAMLRADLKPSRYKHTLGVASTAMRLAPVCGVDVHRAELAALLHDCAKYLPMDEMRKQVKKHIVDVDSAELENVSVLHAPAGAVLAQEKYGVRDPEILSAIRKHTLGAAEMSALDALIYTADFIEPNREEFPGLSDARNLAETDIFLAMRKCAELTNQYLIGQCKKPHARSIAMLNSNSNAKIQK